MCHGLKEEWEGTPGLYSHTDKNAENDTCRQETVIYVALYLHDITPEYLNFPPKAEAVHPSIRRDMDGKQKEKLVLFRPFPTTPDKRHGFLHQAGGQAVRTYHLHAETQNSCIVSVDSSMRQRSQE